MHYKTRTYLDEAVEVRSTGFDMNEVWSMYAKISFWSCGSLARDLHTNAVYLRKYYIFCSACLYVYDARRPGRI